MGILFIFGARAFEVLYLINNSEFNKNSYKLVFDKEKFLPLKLVGLMLDAIRAKM